MNTSTTAHECPLCGSTRLEVRHDYSVTYRYLKQNHVLEGQEHTLCLECEISFFTEDQLDRNQQLFFEFEQKIVKGIAPREVRELRDKYLITQEQATRIFECGSPTAFSKWERGDSAPTGPTALLLRMALEDSSFMEKLATRAGVRIDIPDRIAATPSAPHKPQPAIADFVCKMLTREWVVHNPSRLEVSHEHTVLWMLADVDPAISHEIVSLEASNMQRHFLATESSISKPDASPEHIPSTWMPPRHHAGLDS